MALVVVALVDPFPSEVEIDEHPELVAVGWKVGTWVEKEPEMDNRYMEGYYMYFGAAGRAVEVCLGERHGLSSASAADIEKEQLDLESFPYSWPYFEAYTVEVEVVVAGYTP